MKKNMVLIGLLVVFLAVFINVAEAGIPTKINYHGCLEDDNGAFTGTAYFKFAIIDDPAMVMSVSWTNDGTSDPEGEPDSAVPVTVTAGVFNVLLGDTSLTNTDGTSVDEIEETVLASNGVAYLRVWVSTTTADGTYDKLTPDKELVSVPYAYQCYNANYVGGLDPDDLVDKTSSQTLTGKGISGSDNTITDISDSSLSQITTADKVAGSAVELTATGSLEDASGLKVKLDGNSLESSVSGLKVNLAGNSLAITAGGMMVSPNYTGCSAIAELGTVETGVWEATPIEDTYLDTIDDADKVSGSAVQLNSEGGLENDSGLKIKLDGSSLSLSSDGLKLNGSYATYDAIVDAAGDGDYTSIVSACSGEGEDAVIFVKNGTYNETSKISIKSGQKIIGESRSGVLIVSSASICIGFPLERAGSSDYSIDVTNGSATVLNTDTTNASWQDDNLDTGDYIIIGGTPYSIASVVNNYTLVLDEEYQGVDRTNADYVAGDFYENIELRNFTLQGTATSGYCYGIKIYNCINTVFSNIHISSYNTASGAEGINLHYTYNSIVENCKIENITEFGLVVKNSSNNCFSDIFMTQCGSDGGTYDGAIYLSYAENNAFTNVVLTNSLNGLAIYSYCKKNIFNGLQIMNCSSYAIRELATGEHNIFSNIFSNGSMLLQGDYGCLSNCTADSLIYYPATAGRAVGCAASTGNLTFNSAVADAANIEY